MPAHRTTPTHHDIHGCVTSTKPLSGLTLRAGWYRLVYYGASGETKSKNLWTADKDEAVKLRDKLYAAARKEGRGGCSKVQRKAQEVLANPECLIGIKFKVTYGNHVRYFEALDAAVACRNKIAADIVKKAGKSLKSGEVGV